MIENFPYTLTVMLDGDSVEFTDLKLIVDNQGSWKIISKIDRLKGGQYTFHTWVSKKYTKYKVVAQSSSTDAKESNDFNLTKSSRIQLPPIHLQSVT